MYLFERMKTLVNYIEKGLEISGITFLDFPKSLNHFLILFKINYYFHKTVQKLPPY